MQVAVPPGVYEKLREVLELVVGEELKRRHARSFAVAPGESPGNPYCAASKKPGILASAASLMVSW